MCSSSHVAAPSSVLQNLAQEKLCALVLQVVEELLRLIILDDLARIHKEYPIGHGLGESF
jgi:hypothetical protein